MGKSKAWISAMRLRTLPLSFSVIIVGNALVYEAISFRWSIFGLSLLTTLLLQILSNLANDYGDSKKGADNENRIGPERAIQSGEISSSAMLKAIILCATLSLISGVSLLTFAFKNEINWTFISFLILGVLSIAAAIKYTVGKKAYGYSGLGDLFVFIFFGLVGVIGSAYLHHQEFRLTFLLYGVVMGCLSVAVLNLNNMRDQVNDAAVGKITLVVKLGKQKSKTYHFGLFLITYTCLLWPIFQDFIEHRTILLSYFPIFLIHFFHLKKIKSIEEPKNFDPELKKIALSTFLLSLIIFAQVFFLM